MNNNGSLSSFMITMERGPNIDESLGWHRFPIHINMTLCKNVPNVIKNILREYFVVDVIGPLIANRLKGYTGVMLSEQLARLESVKRDLLLLPDTNDLVDIINERLVMVTKSCAEAEQRVATMVITVPRYGRVDQIIRGVFEIKGGNQVPEIKLDCPPEDRGLEFTIQIL